jgi:hypothetical protein
LYLSMVVLFFFTFSKILGTLSFSRFSNNDDKSTPFILLER